MIDKMMIKVGTENEKWELLSNESNAKNVIRDGGYLIVAKIEDRMAGYLWAFKRTIPAPVDQDEIFINIIEVIDTNFRCQGVASKMINELLKIAKKEKVYQVRAYCSIDNVPSHRLWLKNHFSISPIKMQDGSIPGSFVSYVL